MPLSLSARIAFEQTYSEIEGDSASSTELYCLLSALANVPLRQEIAVTGSVDQFGNVQPIGGANEKIEGFFRYCNSKGLSGRQGVMIPKRNVIHLMLSQEVLDAVSEGNFHIWAVDTIDQGIEILTGKPAGAPDEQGVYPEDSIHGLVKKQLVSWMKEAARLKKEFGIDGEKESEKTEE